MSSVPQHYSALNLGDNLLLTRDGNVKIGDLGLAAILDDSLTRRTLAGTVFWMAPEMLAEKQYTYSVSSCVFNSIVSYIRLISTALERLCMNWPQLSLHSLERLMSKVRKKVSH